MFYTQKGCHCPFNNETKVRWMSSGLIDMHVHTTASDGTKTPREMVFFARESGLKAAAITDHDTIEGVAEALAAGEEAGIEVVPGVEISVDYPGEMHILGYYVDYTNRKLLEGLGLLRAYRDRRNPMMIEKLRQMGFDISMAEVAGAADGKVVGRPHFAAVMVEKGYVSDYQEAFEKYLGAGQPAYIKKERLTPREGIEMIMSAGGIPVLAHPKYVKIKDDNGLAELIRQLMGYGLKGIEVFYTTHAREETRKFLNLAERCGLFVTGGTDYHGANKPDIQIGRGRGGLAIPYGLLAKIKNAK